VFAMQQLSRAAERVITACAMVRGSTGRSERDQQYQKQGGSQFKKRIIF
jgi:hypothetical protein